MIREMYEMMFLGFASLFALGAYLLNHCINSAYEIQASVFNSQLFEYADYMVNNL